MKLDLPERIETSRLILQRLRYEDAEEIFYVYAGKEEATKYVAWPTHQSVRDTRMFLHSAVAAWEKGTDYSFSIRLRGTNRLVGGIGMIHDEGKIQIGYILGPRHWGTGYATEACQAILAAVKSLPGIYRIGTFADVDNVASIRVLQKAGLVEEARLEKWFRFVNQGNQPKDCVVFKWP